MKPICLLLSLLFLALVSSCNPVQQTQEAANNNILILGNSSEPKALDPHLVSGVLENNLLSSMFEALCIDHPSKDATSMPGSAARWEANNDFTLWTFYLQPEGKWSDGKPVTTEDFLFAYERILTPELGAVYAEMLYFIQGAEEFNKGEVKDFSQVGVKALDSHTLQIKLKAPTPFLPEVVKHFTWYPVPKHVVLAHGKISDSFTPWSKEKNLVGNGAFQLTSWRINQHIQVRQNPHYWDRDNLKLQGINFLPIKNAFTEMRMFEDKQIHITYSVPSELKKYAKKNHPESLRQEPYVGTSFIRCNVDNDFLQHVELRHALSLAIDRDLYVDVIRNGSGSAAHALTPPLSGYNNPQLIDFNLEQAKANMELLRAKIGDEPIKLRILITESDSARRSAELLQATWRKHLGITLSIKTADWGTYLQKQKTGEYDLAAAGWIGDYLDPTTFLDMWTEGNGNNNTNWADATYEKYLEEASQMADPQARFDKLAKAEELLLEAAPIIPIFWFDTSYFIDTRVSNWNPLLLNNHPYKFVYFDK